MRDKIVETLGGIAPFQKTFGLCEVHFDHQHPFKAAPQQGQPCLIAEPVGDLDPDQGGWLQLLDRSGALEQMPIDATEHILFKHDHGLPFHRPSWGKREGCRGTVLPSAGFTAIGVRPV
ncbi:hypothetical protein [Ochrobactrum quorumnocens]|uniref:hypothetical protein n=1 Tax=Ochrobactrum quorumnocens TaxID=271865 RepID=UPI00296EAEA4